MMDYAELIASQINVRKAQTAATIELLDKENTIPFIARYRKEMTGGLDEEQLRNISGLLAKLRALNERREVIIRSVEEQGKMTPELQQQLLTAETVTALEDLYLPYKPKRKTRAGIAREKGLQGLADLITGQLQTQKTLEQLAAPYLNEEVQTAEDAWAGGRDIVAECISDHPEVRRILREKARQWGKIQCNKKENVEDARAVYLTYYNFEGQIDHLRPYQVLAINRGEEEKILHVKVVILERDWRGAIATVFRSEVISPLADQLEDAIQDAAERLLLPAIERDIHRELTEKADKHAIKVFTANLRALISQPPLSGYIVLGIDPGFRTGCKVAVVDSTGKVLATTTIFPHEPQKRHDQAINTLASLIHEYHVNIIVIGNGTASRETETLVAELILYEEKLKYIIINEAGASVYSASPLARAELPDLDVSMRGAVSIARRIQDPLAELVKIEPKSIGIGLYQHDVDQKQLGEALKGVVESVVNAVGVDVNTASPALLTYVAGIGQKLAEKIVAYRDENGPFSTRDSLRKVSGLGTKAFEQSAGFLRIRGGENPLDASVIHPESYPAALEVLRKSGLSPQIEPASRRPALIALQKVQPLELLAKELAIGVPTLEDIFEQLSEPGRDPRDNIQAPLLRSDVLKIEDLVVGMKLKGTVRNVVDFGAFVDIGVKQDGLLHRTQILPGITLRVGDIVDIEILKVETDRGRIALRGVGSIPTRGAGTTSTS